MRPSDFDYELPEERIALYPPEERGSTRLEVLDRNTGRITHARYAGLSGFLGEGDLLVLNNTRVILARLQARKTTGAKIELVLLEKHEGEQELAMYRGRLRQGDRLVTEGGELVVESIMGEGVASLSSPDGPVADLFQRYGAVPIPPYLRRDAEEVDRERYQTVFAEVPGSVAAPTASLNLTPDILHELEDTGVEIAYMTLHVGLGTFLPIRTEDFSSHVMHREYYHIPAETAEAVSRVRNGQGRVVAVGTTVTRALEHAASRLLEEDVPSALSGEADIFIYPGYEFRVIEGLLTNYHAPRSTVLMLTAAFASPDFLRRAYREALEREYRFLSYGDSMLIL